MSFSEFFISRPIFAGVISIVITIAGLIASQVLPIAQYPEIAPPTVVITANYPAPAPKRSREPSQHPSKSSSPASRT
jgi:multidrug efflux pump subunit AcrB